MRNRNYFPLGKAQGKAFCNRKNETTWLLGNIRAGKHSLLIAPRRFGKSSLADHVVEKCKMPSITLNFNTCTDENDIELLIRQGVIQLIGKSLGHVDKLINSIKSYSKNLIPTLTFKAQLVELELSTTNKTTAAVKIEESLLLLEKLLTEKKCFAVMQLDEFQMVGLIAKGKGVEAAIRNVAQEMKNLSLIFSGSIRRLLLTMFDNEGRPLYKLCRKLHLERILREHYHQHLNVAAIATWQKKLDDSVIDRILMLSERHPYYVNYLCDIIWTNCTQFPKIKDVNQAWQQVLEEEQSDGNQEIAALSLKQKKLLKFIANQSGVNLMSAETIKSTGLALSTIAGALTVLTDKDIIEKQEDNYRIINPIIHHILLEGIVVM